MSDVDTLTLLWWAWNANQRAKKTTSRKDQASWYTTKASYLALALTVNDAAIKQRGIFRDGTTNQLCAFWAIHGVGCIAFHLCPERDAIIASVLERTPIPEGPKPARIDSIRSWRTKHRPKF